MACSRVISFSLALLIIQPIHDHLMFIAITEPDQKTPQHVPRSSARSPHVADSFPMLRMNELRRHAVHRSLIHQQFAYLTGDILSNKRADIGLPFGESTHSGWLIWIRLLKFIFTKAHFTIMAVELYAVIRSIVATDMRDCPVVPSISTTLNPHAVMDAE